MLKNKLYVVIDNIRSRENVGSIFRTADAVGASKIYLCGITPTPPHPKISKTALGAEKWIPWEYYKQTWRLLEKLKKEKLYIITLERTSESINIFKFKKPKNRSIVLVVGNEVKGLNPRILKYAQKKAAIPMYGRKESLNVGVAAGIALYVIRNSGKVGESRS